MIYVDMWNGSFVLKLKKEIEISFIYFYCN